MKIDTEHIVFSLQRWKYRRLALIDDPSLWVSMHPYLGHLIQAGYDKSWPVRDHLHSIVEASRNHRKAQAIRDVYGDTGEIKHWKHDGDAEDIYASAQRQWGWSGPRRAIGLNPVVVFNDSVTRMRQRFGEIGA